MAETNFNPIESLQVNTSDKVAGLSNRPNQSGVYGVSGLSATELKAHFDKYADAIAKKVNEIIDKLSSGNGDYLSIGDGKSLAMLIASFADGSWANSFNIKLSGDESNSTLYARLNLILKSLSDHLENGAHIKKDSVGTDNIQDKAVTESKIQDGAVTTGKLSQYDQNRIGNAFKSVSYNGTTGELSFTNNKNVTTTVDLPLERLVQKGEYDNDSKKIILTLDNEQTLEISLSDIVESIVNSVGTDNIQDKAVTESKIQDGAVVTKYDKYGNVLSTKLAKDAVYEDAIKNFSVTRDKLASRAVEYSSLVYEVEKHIQDSFSGASYDGSTLKLSRNRLTDGTGTPPEELAIPIPIKGLEQRIENLEGLTLQQITDSTMAYEKVVPAGSGQYAALNKLGGICVKTFANHNLCTADGVYECRGDYKDINLGDLSHFDDGMYYLSIDAPAGLYKMELNAEGYGNTIATGYGSSLTFQYDKMEFDGLEFYIRLVSEYYEYGEEGARELDGEAKNFLLCKESDAFKGYAPFGYVNVEAKPTRIESLGANLLNMDCEAKNPSSITDDANMKRIFTPGTYFVGMSANNYCKPYVVQLIEKSVSSFTFRAESNAYGVSFPLKLLPNTTYWIRWERTGGTANCFYSFYADDGTYLSNSYVSSKKSFTTDDFGNVVIHFVAGEGNVDITISNIMLNRGTESVPYKAYTAEPIDTFEIPEAIRNLPGYGIGKSETENNYIDFDRKVFVEAYGLDGEGGVELLPSVKVKPIADFLPDYGKHFYLTVEPGGTIRFVNENSSPIPSTVNYVKKL